MYFVNVRSLKPLYFFDNSKRDIIYIYFNLKISCRYFKRTEKRVRREILYFSLFKDANIEWRSVNIMIKSLLKSQLKLWYMRSYKKVSLCFKSVSWNLNKASELLTIPLPRSWELFRHLNIKENILGKLVWKGIQRSY